MKINIGDAAVINSKIKGNGKLTGIVIRITAKHMDGSFTAKAIYSSDSYRLIRSEFDLISSKWKKKYRKLRKKYEFQREVIKELDESVSVLHMDIQELKFQKDQR